MGEVSPTFFRRWGYNIPCPTHIFFLYVLYLERFQNKSDFCHVLCEELFTRRWGKNLAEGGPLATVGMALPNTSKKS